MDLSKKTALVMDHGVFIEVAFRLARDFGKVYFCHPSWAAAQTDLSKRPIGDGFSEIHWVDEPEELIDAGDIDLVVFPDVHHAKRQAHFERLGVPVWGARKADWLELDKVQWKDFQQIHDMKTSDYEVIRGLEALREFCRNEKDYWIKLSPQLRGLVETFHHSNYEETRDTLDAIGVEAELLQDVLTFIAEKPIKSDLEGGLDTYTVNGKHPSVAVQGYEKKDKCYFATLMPYDEIPEEIRSVSDPLWPVFKEFGAKQFVSSEVKITDEGSFLLDNTIRLPSPAGEEQMELYENFSEIIYEGAQGRLVEPVTTAKFACEAMIEHLGDSKNWRSLVVDDSVRQWVKLYSCVKVGNRIGIAPADHHVIGAVVGIGDTPQEALDHLKENAEPLKEQPVLVHVDAMASVLIEIEEAESKGIEFSTGHEMPEPAEVLE